MAPRFSHGEFVIPPTDDNSQDTREADPLFQRGKTQRLTLTQCIVYLIGFSDGLTHLASLSILYLLKDDLGLLPAQVSAIFIAQSLPWILKPIFAFCSDSYPLFGRRRQPYLIICGILQAVGFVTMGLLRPQLFNCILSLVIISTAGAFSSAVAEALVVEKSIAEIHSQPSDEISNFMLSKAAGSLAVAYLSGYLLEKVTKKEIFLCTALFPLAISCLTLFIAEAPTYASLMAIEQLKALKRFMTQRIIWGPALYVLMYTLGPDYDDALFFYYTEKLKFSPSFLGTLRFTYGIATLVGVAVYRHSLKAAPLKKILFWTIVISFPIYISPIVLISGLNLKFGISDQIFVLSGGFLVEAIAELQLLPMLVLAASICPPHLEGSVYSTMMSIRNLGGGISKILSSISLHLLNITATNFRRLSFYVLLCGVFLLFPLFLINLVPTEAEVQSARAKHYKDAHGSSEEGS